MEETQRELSATYTDVSLSYDGTFDVTFDMTEDVEEALFTAFRSEIGSRLERGQMPEQRLHLFQRLAEQRSEHPPWIEARDDIRTYDLELTTGDYRILTTIVGNSLSNVLRPAGSETYRMLVEIWDDITGQMIQAQMEADADTPDGPENGTFKCFVQGMQFKMYENERTGDNWYVCVDCGQSYSEIGDTHACNE